MSNTISQKPFELGTLTQDPSGRMKMSSKMDNFDLHGIVQSLHTAQEKSIKPYEDEIQFRKDKIIPSLQDLYQKTKDLKATLWPFEADVFQRYTAKIHGADGSVGSDAMKIEVKEKGPTEDSLKISIQKLAQKGYVNSQTSFDLQPPLGMTGEFMLNGSIISVQENDTIAMIAEKINAQKGAVASLIYREDQHVYLSLTHHALGVPLSYESNDVTTALGLPEYPENELTNQNLGAHFTVNGIALHSKTNTIAPLKDVSITLLRTTEQAFDITFSLDHGATLHHITQFVDRYNALSTLLKTHEHYDMGAQKPHPDAHLYGHELLKTLDQSFKSVIVRFNDLFEEVGLHVQDRMMSVDQKKMTDALTTRPFDVQKIFGHYFQESLESLTQKGGDNPFDVATRRLQQDDKKSQESIDGMKERYQNKIESIEKKIERLHAVRMKAHTIQRSIEAWMHRDER